MEEIKLTPEELKEAIDFGKLIGKGFYSRVFTYKGKLIKLDNRLYDLLKVNDPRFSHEVIHDRYKWEKDDFNDRKQLEELAKRQHLIRPKVPEGIITIKDSDSKVDGISPGIIIPHFVNYEELKKISKHDYKQLLIIFRKIFDDLRNLADNEIANEDLKDDNILYNDKDAQIIDMSGDHVKVGKHYEGPETMYGTFASIIDDYYMKNDLIPIYDKINDKASEKDIANMITEFEKQTRKK